MLKVLLLNAFKAFYIKLHNKNKIALIDVSTHTDKSVVFKTTIKSSFGHCSTTGITYFLFNA